MQFKDEAVNDHSAISNVPEAGTSAVLGSHASFQPPTSITADISGPPSEQIHSQQQFTLPSDFDLPQETLDHLEADRDTFDRSFGGLLVQLDYDMPQQDQWVSHPQQDLQDHPYQQWSTLESQGLSGPQQSWQQYSVPQSQSGSVNNASNDDMHYERSPRTHQPQGSPLVSTVWNTRETPDNYAAHHSLQLGVFNDAASATPISATIVPGVSTAQAKQQLDEQVRYAMGNTEDLGPVPSAHFMYHCCEAMLWAARDRAKERDQAICKATKRFCEMLNTPKGFSTTLPLLNKLSFITEAYGHRPLKQLILQSLRQTLHRGLPNKLQRGLLQDVFDLLLDTAQWTDDTAANNKARADRIYTAAVAATNNMSKFALAARYNQAWVLLENKQFGDAYEILLRESSQCESVFGTHDLQTICWLATLARAHLMRGEARRAVSLMKESVVTRAEDAYHRNHPLYWEIRHRIGLFLCKLAKDNTIPDSTEDFWRKERRV